MELVDGRRSALAPTRRGRLPAGVGAESRPIQTVRRCEPRARCAAHLADRAAQGTSWTSPACARRSRSSPRVWPRSTTRDRFTATSSRPTCWSHAEGRVVILDFGLATEWEVRTTFLGAGTPAYMAPEQAIARAGRSCGRLVQLWRDAVRSADRGSALRWPGARDPVPEAAARMPSRFASSLLMHRRRWPICARPCWRGNPIDDRTRARSCRPWVRPLRAWGRQPGPRRVPRPCSAGRVPEWPALRSAFADVVAGTRLAVLVSGEPGIGKTELCRRFLEVAGYRDRQARWSPPAATSVSSCPSRRLMA